MAIARVLEERSMHLAVKYFHGQGTWMSAGTGPCHACSDWRRYENSGPIVRIGPAVYTMKMLRHKYTLKFEAGKLRWR